MKSNLSVFTVALGVIALGTAFAPAARAGCGNYPGLASRAIVKPASFVPGSGMMGDWDDHDRGEASIVGLWRVKVVSRGNQAFNIPDGAELDQGYSAWHSDGTEILNSGRDPLTGSFCLGIWKQTGRSSFKLNHYAMNWSGLTVDGNGKVIIDPNTKQPLNVLVGPTNIREEVTLDADKDSFQGIFTVENYDQNGKSLIRLTGKVTGVRLTANSPGFVQ